MARKLGLLALGCFAWLWLVGSLLVLAGSASTGSTLEGSSVGARIIAALLALAVFALAGYLVALWYGLPLSRRVWAAVLAPIIGIAATFALVSIFNALNVPLLSPNIRMSAAANSALIQTPVVVLSGWLVVTVLRRFRLKQHT